MRRTGFSLVELMIVVAILGILAGIAIPSYINMGLKAKRAELPGNADGIKAAQLAYDASFDTYLECELQPRGDAGLDKNAVPWNHSASDWLLLGWAPDGDVRGNYQVGTNEADHPGIAFLVTARTDLDDDETVAEYTASDVTNAMITIGRERYY